MHSARIKSWLLYRRFVTILVTLISYFQNSALPLTLCLRLSHPLGLIENNRTFDSDVRAQTGSERAVQHGASVSEQHSGPDDVFWDTATDAPLVDALRVHRAVLRTAAGVREAGQPEGSDRRELGGHPDRRVDDRVVSVLLTSSANG